MQQDLLQQLRDIHLPEAPGWWPPAIGWWVLALVVAAVLAWVIWRLVVRWRQFRPARAARALFCDLSQRMATGALSPEQFVHQSNELLRRFAIHGQGHRSLAPQSGDQWLAYLDKRYGQPAFSRGPGRCLGTDRFRPDPVFDAPGLDRLMHWYFAQECARYWRWSRPRRRSNHQ